MPTKRIVIIGAGVIGLFSALYLRRRGFDVTVIDRRAATRDGCSFGNAGMIVPSHFVPLAAPGMVKLGLKWMWNPKSPFYIKPRLSWDLLSWGVHFWKASNRAQVDRAAPVLRDLHLASRAMYEELAAEAGADFDFTPRGLLMLCKTAHGLAEEAHGAELAAKLGIPAEVMDKAAVAKFEPNMPADVEGGVLYPRDCHLSPQKLMAWLERELATAGCTIHWESTVEAIDTRDGLVRTARTSTGTIEADELVVAGGVWSDALGRQLGLHLPMQAGKGYSLTLQQPRHLPNTCAILTEARVAVTPMGPTLRFGGTMEMAGVNESVTRARVDGIIQSACRYYPGFRPDDFAGITPWHGLRPCAPDGMPYLGRSPRHQNVIIATGHAMMGISLAPVTGRIVSELATAEKPSVDLALMSPGRFG